MCAFVEYAAMQKFIPFEDQWNELDALDVAMLVPYHVGVPCEHGLGTSDQRMTPGSPSIVNVSPGFRARPDAVPAASSRT